jgi:hypothetical protein
MQAAQNALGRARMIVLDKMSGQSDLLELILPKGLHEESTGISKDIRDEHHNVPQES